MDEIPTGTVTWLVILFCVIGAIVGALFNAGQTAIGWGIIFSFAIVWLFLGWLIRFFVPQYTEYESTTPVPIIQEQIIERYYVIHLEGARHRIPFFDMTPEQWQNLANLIVRSKYSYTQDFFVDVLKDRAKGRQVYHFVSGALNREDIFLNVYGSGYKLTGPGEEFFDKLAAGDVSVLDGLEE